MMIYQDITRKKIRLIRLLWTLSILLLGLALSGLLYPAGAEVLLCGDPLSPDPDGIYRLRGPLTCSSTDDIKEILYIDEAYTEFDLRGFEATGDGKITGILIDAENLDIVDETFRKNVGIVGGTFRKCKTALRVKEGSNGCEIEKFKAIDSSDKAIRIQSDGNSIVNSFCFKAGGACFEIDGKDNDLIRLKAIDSSDNAIKEKEGCDNNFLYHCMSLRAGSDAFELRAAGPYGTRAEWCTAIRSGTPENPARGIRFRGPGSAYKCSAFDNSAEGFQIQKEVSDVTIERCLAINNAEDGIEIEMDATGNTVKRNIAFANGDGEYFWDLTERNTIDGEADGDPTCAFNTWERNKFKTSNIDCIE